MDKGEKHASASTVFRDRRELCDELVGGGFTLKTVATTR